jgi:peptidoglycan-associated lipoprotein
MRSRSIPANLFLVAALAAVAVSAGACRHRRPVTTPEAAPPAPAAEAPAPSAPAPAVEAPSAPAPAADPLSGDLESVNAYLRRQGLLGDAFFEYDQAQLSEDARAQLARNGQFLREHPQFRLTVEGHCDERGTAEYNLALGERRASVARDYMVSLGVGADRLHTVSYGKERPVCQDSDESCWSQNRRAHPLVTGRSDG